MKRQRGISLLEHSICLVAVGVVSYAAYFNMQSSASGLFERVGGELTLSAGGGTDTSNAGGFECFGSARNDCSITPTPEPFPTDAHSNDDEEGAPLTETAAPTPKPIPTRP